MGLTTMGCGLLLMGFGCCLLSVDARVDGFVVETGSVACLWAVQVVCGCHQCSWVGADAHGWWNCHTLVWMPCHHGHYWGCVGVGVIIVAGIVVGIVLVGTLGRGTYFPNRQMIRHMLIRGIIAQHFTSHLSGG